MALSGKKIGASILRDIPEEMNTKPKIYSRVTVRFSWLTLNKETVTQFIGYNTAARFETI
jgi:hypothetical protein